MTKVKQLAFSLFKPMHLALAVMVIISAIAVVFSSYQSRQLFHQLQTLQQEVGSMQSEWRQLLLEEGAFASHVRVEQKALEDLGMQAPGADNTVAVNLRQPL